MKTVKYKPLQYAGCYSLDLYCDRECGADNCGHGDFEARCEQFTGETFSQCAAEARKSGWKIERATRTATCPRCVALTKKAQRILKPDKGKL